MENFIVSARKYRPATFDTVIGQKSITSTLKNAIKSGHVGQAYLFCGPRGVGKTTCARIFAKTLNCKNITEDIEACGTCESCKAFSSNRSYNIHELDAASNNSVEDIRQLIEQVRIPPQVGRYSIYIIDEVHMLSASAFNAFLKTLEEPPRHAIFILATTEKHKIIPTILSRCQIFDFNRIMVSDMVDFLAGIAEKEEVTYETDALNVIAQKADGAMRDALSIFDQIVSFSGNEITYSKVIENLNILDYEYYFSITNAFIQEDYVKCLLIFDEILANGFDAQNFLNGLASHFRNLLVSKDKQVLHLLEVGENIKERYLEQTANCPVTFLLEALNICSTFDIGFKASRNQRLHVELALLKLSNLNKSKKKEIEVTSPYGKAVEDKQSEKNKISSRVTENPDKEESANTVAPQKKKNYSGIGMSISDKLNQTPDIVDQTNQPRPKDNTEEDLAGSGVFENQNITPEKLKEKYTKYVETLRETRPRMYSSLINKIPGLAADNKIQINLDNGSQMEDFNRDIKPFLLKFLKKELANSGITIELTITEQQDNKLLYSPKDKFDHMVAKNPLLGKLTQRFNLELD